jgi:DNA-binding MarR family transcriptional regulator
MYYPRVLEATAAAPASAVAPIDDVAHALMALLRPQGPPPAGPGVELTMTQLRLLFRLRHGGPATMGEIARSAGVSLQSATALIERVQRRGLVAREHREDDRRVVECHLTETGRALVDEIAGQRTASVRATLSVLDPDELAHFHGLLRLMLERNGRLAR